MIKYGLLWKPDRPTMWAIVQVKFMPKMKLRCHNSSHRVPFVMKTEQHKETIARIGVLYTENDTELL